MSDAPRQILMPGETAQAAAQAAATADSAVPAPERKKPGPKPRAAQAAAATAGDDLDQFDDDELPPRPAAPAAPAAVTAAASLSAEQMLLVQQLVAEGVRAAMSSRDPSTAVKIAAKAAQPQRLPSQDEARVMCEDMVAKNVRPRAILTTDGWYAHPEMARVRDHGVAKLQVD